MLWHILNIANKTARRFGFLRSAEQILLLNKNLNYKFNSIIIISKYMYGFPRYHEVPYSARCHFEWMTSP